jgi:hypothetical protein
LAFGIVAVWVTRPLGAHLLDHSLVAYPYTAFDIPLNAWILSWVSRALVTRPSALFDANIYHPEPDALAYTEHMLGSAPFFGPAFLATGNPALALNVMILAGLVLSAVGTYWVTWRWTGSRAAAAFAGLVVGFQATQVRALGPNLQTTQYLPFVLLFLERVLSGAGMAATLGLTAALAGQSLASYYYAYPTILATTLAVAAACIARGTRPSRAALARVALALLATAAILALVSAPYFRVAARGTDTIYTMTGLFEERPTRLGQLGGLLVGRLGVPAAILAALGVLAAFLPSTGAMARRRVLILVAWIVVACVLASGPTLLIGDTALMMPARLLDQWAPGFAALRDRRRLFVVAPVALGVLAGLGIAALAGGRSRRGAVAAVAAAIALAATAARANLDACRLIALPTGAQVPPVYRDLARRERGPVLELPVAVELREVPSAVQQTWYEYFSIFHWQPLLNGYASYWPPSLEIVMAMARALPEPRALENLADCTGVRWIVAHTALMPREQREAFLAGTPGLRLAGRFGDDLLFETERARPGGECGTSLRSRDAVTTVEGTPLASLPPNGRLVAFESVVVAPELVRPPRPAALAVPVRIRNTGPATWPAVALDDTYLVRLSYLWRDAAGQPLPFVWRLWTRLPFDVRPGEAVDVPVAIRLPSGPGSYRLEIVVRQGLQGQFDASGPAADPTPVVVR